MSELCTLLARHCHTAMTVSAIPRLTLTRADAPTQPVSGFYSPLLCVVAQGRKRIRLGAEEYTYDPTSYLIVSADLPVIGQVVEAPVLGLTLMLEPTILAGLLLEMPAGVVAPSTSRGMAVSPVDDDLLGPVLRLLRLLAQPAHIPVLAPLIEREILYRLLLGPQGKMLRELALPASPLSHIGRAIQAIRTRFDETLPVEELARLAGMSTPTFHRHFRAVTSLSPLQFQKRIRLHEARRRLLAEHTDAATAGFAVGYESPSQFSREYRRMFGVPPGRDATEVRRSLVRT